MEPLMTVTDVARYLKVTPRTVYSFLENGTLRGIKIGRSWRVRRLDLERLGQEPAAILSYMGQIKDGAVTDARNRLLSEMTNMVGEEYEDILRYLGLIRSSRSLRRYKGVFDSAPCAALIVDPSGSILEANDCALRLFNLNEEDLPAVRVSDLPALSTLTDVDSLIENARNAHRNGICGSIPCPADMKVGDASIQRIWVIPSEFDEIVLWIRCAESLNEASQKK